LACNGRRKRFLFMPFRHNSICKNFWWFLVFFYPPVSAFFKNFLESKKLLTPPCSSFFNNPQRTNGFIQKGYLITSSSFWQLPLCIKMGSQMFENCGFKVYNNWLFTDLYISEPQKTTKDQKKNIWIW
jgi:hypothetical protein